MTPNLSLSLGIIAAATPIPAPFTSIAADGWQAVYSGTPTDLALTPFTVRRAGFDATGAAATISETLRTTKRVRQPYPNQTSFTANNVALEDYIYQGDTVVGATNNSTEVSPKPIATWGMMDRTLVGNSIAWEIIPFHRNARLGRQVACVRVRATDGTNTTAWQTVSTTAVSSSCEGSNPVEVYAGTLDITALNNDSLITLQGQVFPWFGVSASILDSATESEYRFTPRYFYKNTTRFAAPNLIYVASTGNDSTGVTSTTAATAKATPCLTVGGAIARAVTLLGSASINVLSGLEIRIVDGVSMGTVGFITANQDAAAIKVTRDPDVARSAAVITMSATFRPYSGGNSGTEQLTESALTFDDVSITLGSNVNFQGETARKLHIQMRNVNFNWNSVASSSGLKNNSHVSFFGMTATNYSAGLSYTTAGDNRIIRGVSGSMNNGAIDGYNVIGCSMSAARIAAGQAQRGCIIYNNSLPSPPTNLAAINVVAATAGADLGPIAVVQNLAPTITTGAGNAGIRISGDSDNGNVTHLICHYNTTPGDEGYGRWNVLYDETPATARTHKLASFKGNLGPQLNTKGDVFMSDGTRTGNFAFHHGVGCAGVYTEDADSGGGGLSFGQAYGGVDSDIAGGNILFTDDRSTVASGPTAGSTGGDYTLQSGSPARDLFSEYLLGFDITGAARPTSGTVDAGCYA